MALIPIPRQFTPDFSNPLVAPISGTIDVDSTPVKSSLLAYFGQQKDYVSGAVPTLQGAAVTSPVKFENTSSSGTNRAYWTDAQIGDPLGGAGDFFLEGLITVPGTGIENFGRIYDHTYAQIGVYIDEPSNTLGFFLNNGGIDTLSTGITFTDNEPFNFLISRKGSAISFYKNGIFKASLSYSTAVASVTARHNLFDRDDGGRTFVGGIEFFRFGAVARTSGEALSLSRNPYQLLKPKTQPLYFTASGSAGIVTGDGDLQSQPSATSGTGTVSQNIAGFGFLQSQGSTTTGAGVIEKVGTGALQSQNATTFGIGLVGSVVVGAGSLQSQESTVSGVGSIEVTGAGVLQSQSSSTTGTGTVTQVVVGAGSLQSQSAVSSGTGTVSAGIVGIGILQSQDAVISGTGNIGRVGVGALQSQSATTTGAGTLGRTASGALQAQGAATQGTGRTGPLITPDCYVSFEGRITDSFGFISTITESIALVGAIDDSPVAGIGTIDASPVATIGTTYPQRAFNGIIDNSATAFQGSICC